MYLCVFFVTRNHESDRHIRVLMTRDFSYNNMCSKNNLSDHLGYFHDSENKFFTYDIMNNILHIS